MRSEAEVKERLRMVEIAYGKCSGKSDVYWQKRLQGRMDMLRWVLGEE